MGKEDEQERSGVRDRLEGLIPAEMPLGDDH